MPSANGGTKMLNCCREMKHWYNSQKITDANYVISFTYLLEKPELSICNNQNVKVVGSNISQKNTQDDSIFDL